MKQRTLHLLITKEQLLSLLKAQNTVVALKPNDHTRKLLFDNYGRRKEYDQVRISDGYGKDKPFFIAIFNGFDNAVKPCVLSYSNSLEVEVEKGDYLIYLGEILEAKNVKPKP